MLETTQRSHLLSAIDMNSSFFGFVTSKINAIIFMFYMNFRKRFATKAVVNVFWLRSLSIFNTSHLVTSAELCRLHRKKKKTESKTIHIKIIISFSYTADSVSPTFRCPMLAGFIENITRWREDMFEWHSVIDSE